MAKNLLDKLITMAGNTLAGSRDYNDSSVYVTDSPGLTGVARYLKKVSESTSTGVARYLENKEKLAKPNKVVETSETGAAASGVDQYLSRKSGVDVASAPVKPEEAQEPSSRVAKYLADKESPPTSQPAKEDASTPIVPEVKKILSKVEQYLAKQSDGIKVTELPKVPEVKKILSKVEQYLAKHDSASEKPKSKVEQYVEKHDSVSEKPKSKVEQYVAKHDSTPTKPKSRVEQYLAKQPAKTAKPSTNTNAKRGNNGSQRCQASTVKGTQCNRTANLSKIQRTINKEKHQFLVCSQHKSDSFKPHSSFID